MRRNHVPSGRPLCQRHRSGLNGRWRSLPLFLPRCHRGSWGPEAGAPMCGALRPMGEGVDTLKHRRASTLANTNCEFFWTKNNFVVSSTCTEICNYRNLDSIEKFMETEDERCHVQKVQEPFSTSEKWLVASITTVVASFNSDCMCDWLPATGCLHTNIFFSKWTLRK